MVRSARGRPAIRHSFLRQRTRSYGFEGLYIAGVDEFAQLMYSDCGYKAYGLEIRAKASSLVRKLAQRATGMNNEPLLRLLPNPPHGKKIPWIVYVDVESPLLSDILSIHTAFKNDWVFEIYFLRWLIDIVPLLWVSMQEKITSRIRIAATQNNPITRHPESLRNLTDRQQRKLPSTLRSKQPYKILSELIESVGATPGQADSKSSALPAEFSQSSPSQPESLKDSGNKLVKQTSKLERRRVELEKVVLETSGIPHHHCEWFIAAASHLLAKRFWGMFVWVPHASLLSIPALSGVVRLWERRTGYAISGYYSFNKEAGRTSIEECLSFLLWSIATSCELSVGTLPRSVNAATRLLAGLLASLRYRKIILLDNVDQCVAPMKLLDAMQFCLGENAFVFASSQPGPHMANFRPFQSEEIGNHMPHGNLYFDPALNRGPTNPAFFWG